MDQRRHNEPSVHFCASFSLMLWKIFHELGLQSSWVVSCNSWLGSLHCGDKWGSAHPVPFSDDQVEDDVSGFAEWAELWIAHFQRAEYLEICDTPLAREVLAAVFSLLQGTLWF